jgi:hypothetical protein
LGAALASLDQFWQEVVSLLRALGSTRKADVWGWRMHQLWSIDHCCGQQPTMAGELCQALLQLRFGHGDMMLSQEVHCHCSADVTDCLSVRQKMPSADCFVLMLFAVLDSAMGKPKHHG